MTLDEVMSLADSYADGPHEQGYYGARRNALRAAIEQYARGDAEPVAWGLGPDALGQSSFVSARTKAAAPLTYAQYDVPLYTRPSRPLTDEQIEAIEQRYAGILTTGGGLRQFARAVEMAHGITATAATEG